MPITNLCMAYLPLTSNNACQKRLSKPKRRAGLQKFHVLYNGECMPMRRDKISTLYTEEGRPLLRSPGCKGQATVLWGRPGVAFNISEALTPRKQDSLSCPKHTPGHIWSQGKLACLRRIVMRYDSSSIDSAPQHLPTRITFDRLVFVESTVALFTLRPAESPEPSGMAQRP